MDKKIALMFGVLFLSCLLFGTGVLAEGESGQGKEIPPAPPLEGNSASGAWANPEPLLVEKVQQYAAEQISPDIFASVHIDWENREPVIVLSVTQPLSEKQEKELKALAGKEKLEIRQVDFSEKELLQKQQEIDVQAFEDQGVKIWHTGINVWTNRVEVGIEPFNEQTAQLVYDKYGHEMITVVEGHQAVLLAADLPVSQDGQLVVDQHGDEIVARLPEPDASNAGPVAYLPEPVAPEEKEFIADQPSFFQRVWQAVTSWFRGLFTAD